jgi:ABC-type multidrug transport system fused ATPase/permease subunit
MFLRLMVALCIPAMSYVCLAICATSNSTTANFFQKQIGDSFEYFLYLPAMLERLAYAAGACHRVGQLLEQMDIFDAHPVKTNFEDSYDRIELKNVVATPPIPVVAGEVPQDGTDMVMTFASLCCDCSTNDDKSVELVGFNKTFEDRPLFQNVNLSVAKGQSVCIMGPSGETSFLHIACII